MSENLFTIAAMLRCLLYLQIACIVGSSLITCHTANHTLWQKGDIKDDDENQDESLILEQF